MPHYLLVDLMVDFMPLIIFFQKYSPKELLCSWQDWTTQGEKCTKEKSVDALPADALADILLHKVCFRSLRKGFIVIIYSDSGGWNAKRI